MNPGEFRHKTFLRINNQIQDGTFGDYYTNTNVTYPRFAKLKWVAGEERLDGEQLNLIKNVELTYRYDNITKLLDRFDFIEIGNETFYVKSIEYRGHGNQQTIFVKAHTAIN